MMDKPTIDALLRERFEKWITAPPFEKDVSRYGQTGTYWPGCYEDYQVHLAWDAWKESARITAALAEKESGGWIAVSERLPETDKTVLVDGGIAYQRNGGWFSLTGIEYPGRLIQWNVTHWRPLPPLPKGE